jgi:hypothetical protein
MQVSYLLAPKTFSTINYNYVHPIIEEEFDTPPRKVEESLLQYLYLVI